MPLIGLYTGAYILKHKNTKGFKLGRSRQTAKSAYNGIMKKYKEVKPGSKYHHVGAGVWRIYLIKNDRKRTGKTTEDKKKWGKQPHKWDYKGIDTKGGAVKKRKPNARISDKKTVIVKGEKYSIDISKVKSLSDSINDPPSFKWIFTPKSENSTFRGFKRLYNMSHLHVESKGLPYDDLTEKEFNAFIKSFE